VDTIKANAEHVALARGQIERAGLSGRIAVHHGRFEEVLPALAPGYDLAFFDGFAPDTAKLVVVRKLLATGGVLICANLQLSSRNIFRQWLDDPQNSAQWQLV